MLKSWCVSCHSSPRGCGELGFLHILLSLQSWRGGAFLSAGEPPSPAPGSGRWAPERRQLCVAAAGAGAVARRLRDMRVIALPGSWAASGVWGGGPSPVPRPPRDVAVRAGGGGFFYLLPRNGCVRQLFNWCVWRGVGQRDFLVHPGQAVFAGVPGVASTGAPVHLLEGGGGGNPWHRASAHPLLSQACAHPCPRR